MHVKDLVKQNVLSANIFSIEGDDAFFIKLAEDYFVGLVPSEFRAMNVTFVEKLDVDVLKQAFSAFPIGSPYTVVVVRDTVTRIRAKGTDDDEDSVDKSLMGGLLKSVPQDCILVFENPKFLAQADRLYAEIVDANRLDARALKGEVSALFACGIKPLAVDKLIEYTGRDMARIDSEAQKLTDYAFGREVTAEDVEQMVVADCEFRVYEFTNALVAGQKDTADRIMEMMLRQGSSVGFLANSLINAYRKMLHCALSPLSDAELASIFKVKEYAIKKQRETAARYTKLRLKSIIDRLTDLEYKSRTEMTDAAAFKRMIAFLYEA